MIGLCRWTARILSVATLLLVLAFALGPGPDQLRLGVLTPREWVKLVLFAAGIGGLLAAWRWEMAGAATALLALAALSAVELTLNQRLPGMWFFGLLGMPALLYLTAVLASSRRPFPGS